MGELDTRDVDWPLVEGALASPRRVRSLPSGKLEDLVLFARRLPTALTLLELGFAVVDGVRTLLGLDRVGLFLRSESGRSLAGLVGTNALGQLVDERHLRHVVDREDEDLWRDLTAGRRAFEAIENAPWVVHDERGSHVMGRGWLVRTPIVAGTEAVGHFYNDGALTRAPFRREVQESLAVAASLVAEPLRAARDRTFSARRPGLSRVTRECLELLDAEPASTNVELARRVGVTADRLARTFRAETGSSLLAHRNELRLARYFRGVERAEREGESVGLVELALDAGFGSYSQFHRIFRARFGCSPQNHGSATSDDSATPDDSAKSSPENAKPRGRKSD